MKVTDTHYKNLERRFFVIEDATACQIALCDDYQDGDKAILFCYVKPMGCIAFEVVGKIGKEQELYVDDIPRKIYFDTVLETTLEPFCDQNAINQLNDKVQNILTKEYQEHEDIVATREITEIDHLRQPFYPDVIDVYESVDNLSSTTLATIAGVTAQGKLLLKRLKENGFEDNAHTATFYKAIANDKEVLVAVLDE